MFPIACYSLDHILSDLDLITSSIQQHLTICESRFMQIITTVSGGHHFRLPQSMDMTEFSGDIDIKNQENIDGLTTLCLAAGENHRKIIKQFKEKNMTSVKK
jgi:hypothetical protein